MDSVHHIWCPLSSQEFQDLPDGAETTLTAQRLKRVFNIDIETCSGCGGAMKVIACIEDPIVIKQILDHLKHKAETSGTRALPESRAPPAELLLGLFD